MNSTGIHHIPVGDAEVAVHTAGSGVPLLLLHAFPLDHSMWLGQQPLADQVRLIVPDLRGFGASRGGPPESMAQLADDTVALLDALHVAGPAVVCGVSMGGYVAQHVAVRHPDRVAALILVDTKLEADTLEARAGRAELAAKVGRLGLGILADAMIPRLLAARRPSHPAADRDRIETLLRHTITAQSTAAVQAALGALGGRPDMSGAMGRVVAPVLLVTGAEDVITPPACAEHAAALIADAKLLIVPEAGHLVPLERPDVFNAAALEFLRELPGDRLRGAGPA